MDNKVATYLAELQKSASGFFLKKHADMINRDSSRNSLDGHDFERLLNTQARLQVIDFCLHVFNNTCKQDQTATSHYLNKFVLNQVQTLSCSGIELMFQTKKLKEITDIAEIVVYL